jgi:hypothetical protein
MSTLTKTSNAAHARTHTYSYTVLFVVLVPRPPGFYNSQRELASTIFKLNTTRPYHAVSWRSLIANEPSALSRWSRLLHKLVIDDLDGILKLRVVVCVCVCVSEWGEGEIRWLCATQPHNIAVLLLHLIRDVWTVEWGEMRKKRNYDAAFEQELSDAKWYQKCSVKLWRRRMIDTQTPVIFNAYHRRCTNIIHNNKTNRPHTALHYSNPKS